MSYIAKIYSDKQTHTTIYLWIDRCWVNVSEMTIKEKNVMLFLVYRYNFHVLTNRDRTKN